MGILAGTGPDAQRVAYVKTVKPGSGPGGDDDAGKVGYGGAGPRAWRQREESIVMRHNVEQIAVKTNGILAIRRNLDV